MKTLEFFEGEKIRNLGEKIRHFREKIRKVRRDFLKFSPAGNQEKNYDKDVFYTRFRAVALAFFPFGGHNGSFKELLWLKESKSTKG